MHSILAVASLASSALGQTVQGTITDRASGSPLPGVAVVLLDSADAPLTSALSDERGVFVVRAPRGGLYRLRLEAVGVFSETSADLRIADGETLTRTIPFSGRARTLPAVTVTARPRCVTAPEGGAAVAVLWDEVRKALAVTQLTAEAARYRFDLLQYERELDPKTKSVRRSRSWERAGMTGQPYESIAAESLAAHGYVRETTGGTWYYAPDARTVLSDAFVRTHCLKPAVVRVGDTTLVGLAFEPVRQGKIPDVRGVLWLDAATSRLRALEYRYTGLPRSISSDDFGGRVEFERLPSGAWVVRHWHIRMPRIERQVRAMPSALPEVGPPRLVPVTQDVVVGIIERGGDVRIIPEPSTGATIRVSSIRGLVFDSTHGAPLPGADVWLDAPGQAIPAGRATTDSSGAFRLDDITPGNYTLTVSHARLDALGTSLAPVTLELAPGQRVVLSIATPSLHAFVNATCPGGLADDAAMVRGVVLRSEDGPAIPGARVVARWREYSIPLKSAVEARAELAAVTDASGQFTLCGVPRGTALLVRASEARSRGEPVSVTLTSERVAGVRLLAPEHGAEVRGTVAGRDGKPLSSAEVRIVALDAVARTDARGKYRVSTLPAGTHVVEARAVGYAPVRRTVDLGAREAAVIDIRLDAVVQVLRPVTTTADRDRYRTGFHDRMTRRAGGHFFTNEQIRRSGYTRVTDLLRTVPGLRVRKSGNISIMEFSGRGGRTFSSHGCPVAYAIDGIPFEPTFFGLDGEIGVQNIEAIEIYDAATAPAQYSRRGTGCGVILIWTREQAVPESNEGTSDAPLAQPAARTPKEH